MNKNGFFIILVMLLSSLLSGQEQSAILLTIDDAPVYAKEFKKVYLKNRDVTIKSDTLGFDQYLELFIHYKLKIKEAKRLGLDKKKSYLTELAGYENQLQSNFLSDTTVTQQMLREAYERYSYRVRAKHIMRTLDNNAKPKDTVKAYEFLVKLRDSIMKGSTFEDIALANSQDPSVKNNLGDLGWFTVFSMVYPFETAAYKTAVGQISMPFRTSYGYHIVKPIVKEKVAGYVTVANLLIKETSDRTTKQAKNQIDMLYNQLQQGVSFEALLNAHGEDDETKITNGIMKPFKKGSTNSEMMEIIAFNLDSIGTVSRPFKTNKGWHIIKLVDKQPIESFEAMESKLRIQIKRDDRSKRMRDSFSKDLIKSYNVSLSEKHTLFFETLVSTMALKDLAISKEEEGKELFTIGSKRINYLDFIEFLKASSSEIKQEDDFVEHQLLVFQRKIAVAYYIENLEAENSEYAEVLNEYRNGLLLFDLMESKVWNKAQHDTLGLKAFYLQNIDRYQLEERYKVLKASSVKKKTLENVKALLQKGISLEQIKKNSTTGDIVLVVFNEAILSANELKFKKDQNFAVGDYRVEEGKDYSTLVYINEILPSHTVSLQENRGIVIGDYQRHIEQAWLRRLKESYRIKIDPNTVKNLKKELKN